MGSDLAVRLYALHKRLGEPLPRFSDDDVLDLMVKEAVVLHGMEHEKELEKDASMREWRSKPVGSGTPGFSM